MKPSRIWRKSRPMVAAVVFAAGSAACILALKAGEKLAVSPHRERPRLDTRRADDTIKRAAMVREGAQGITVRIDPKTGGFLPKPPEDSGPPPTAVKGAQVPAPQFSENPSPTPGGGVMIDLKGHFRTPLVATTDADGNVRLEHKATPLADESKK